MEWRSCYEGGCDSYRHSAWNDDGFVIDKKLDKVAVTGVAGYVLAALGFIHSAALGLYPLSPYALGYLSIAVLAFILHLGRDSWFKGPDKFDYI